MLVSFYPSIDVFTRQSKIGIDEAFFSFWEGMFYSEGMCGMAELNRGKERVMWKKSAVTFSFFNKSW